MKEGWQRTEAEEGEQSLLKNGEDTGTFGRGGADGAKQGRDRRDRIGGEREKWSDVNGDRTR